MHQLLFAGVVELGSTALAATSDQLLRAVLDDNDVASLASGVGCDHVLAMHETVLSSGKHSSDTVPTTHNVAPVRLFSLPPRLTNAYRTHRTDLSQSKCVHE